MTFTSLKSNPTLKAGKLIVPCLLLGFSVSSFAQQKIKITSKLAAEAGVVSVGKHPDARYDATMATPQVSVFDAKGRRVFHGGVKEAGAWDASSVISLAHGDSTSKPAVLKNWTETTRALGAPDLKDTKLGGGVVVLYRSEPCPPCERLAAELKTKLSKTPYSNAAWVEVAIGG